VHVVGLVSLTAQHVDDRALVVRDPDQPSGAMWLVENRLRRGFDGSLPGEGLLVWHIDGDVISDTRHLNQVNSGAMLGVALEQADGATHLTDTSGGNHGDGGDPWPGSTGAIRFATATSPSSRDNAGAFTDVELSGIPGARTPVSFLVNVGVTDYDDTPPQVTIHAPATGADWVLGNIHTVVWSATDAVGVVAADIWLSHDGGATFPTRLAHDLAADNWAGTIGSAPGEAKVLRVVCRDAEGNEGMVASGVFAVSDVYPPGVSFTCVLGTGNHVAPGDEVSVSWVTADNVGVEVVDLELSCDDGATWTRTTIVGQASQATGLVWTVPDMNCGQALLRAAATDAAGNVGWEESEPFVINGSTTDVPDAAALQLGPCVPNPFNPRAEVQYSLPAPGRVRLAIFDLSGRRVRVLVNENRESGRHRAVWDGRDGHGRDAASGVYYVRAVTDHGHALLKVTLVR